MAIVYKGRRSRRWRKEDHPRNPRTGEFVEKTGGHASWLMRIANRTQGPSIGGGFIKSGGTLRPAGGKASVGSLKGGEHAKVAGVDQYGKPISFDGYVQGKPGPVTVRQRGKRTPMLAVQMAETPSGGGANWRGTVYVKPDVQVTRTRPKADVARLEGAKAGGSLDEQISAVQAQMDALGTDAAATRRRMELQSELIKLRKQRLAENPALAAQLNARMETQAAERAAAKARPDLIRIMRDAGISDPPGETGGQQTLSRANTRLRRGDDPRDIAKDLRESARDIKGELGNLGDDDRDSVRANGMRMTARILNDVADRLDAIDNQSGIQGKPVDTPRVKQDDGGMAPTTPVAAPAGTMKIGNRDLTADQVIEYAKTKPAKFLEDYAKGKYPNVRSGSNKLTRDNLETAAARIKDGTWTPEQAATQLEGWGKLQTTLGRTPYMFAATALRGNLRPKPGTPEAPKTHAEKIQDSIASYHKSFAGVVIGPDAKAALKELRRKRNVKMPHEISALIEKIDKAEFDALPEADRNEIMQHLDIAMRSGASYEERATLARLRGEAIPERPRAGVGGMSPILAVSMMAAPDSKLARNVRGQIGRATRAAGRGQEQVDDAVKVLKTTNDRDEARRALDGLTVAQLKQVFTGIDRNAPSGRKADLIDKLVNTTVGSRINSRVLRGEGPNSWANDTATARRAAEIRAAESEPEKLSGFERLMGGKFDRSEFGQNEVATKATFTPLRDTDPNSKEGFAAALRTLPGGALRGTAGELESGDIGMREAADRVSQFLRSLAGRTMSDNDRASVADVEKRLRAADRSAFGLDKPAPTPPAASYASITKRATLLAMLRTRGLKAKRGAPDDDLRALLVEDDQRKASGTPTAPVAPRESTDDARTIEQLAGLKRAALLAVRRNTPGTRTPRRGASEREIAEEIVRARKAQAAGEQEDRTAMRDAVLNDPLQLRPPVGDNNLSGDIPAAVNRLAAMPAADAKKLLDVQNTATLLDLARALKVRAVSRNEALKNIPSGLKVERLERMQQRTPTASAPAVSTPATATPAGMSPLRLNAQIDATKRLIDQTSRALAVERSETRNQNLQTEREMGLVNQLRKTEDKLRELRAERAKRVGASPVAAPEAPAGPGTLPPPLPWRPRDMGTIEARRNAVRDATMFRTDFDALPEDRKQAILTELRQVVASGDTQTIPSNRTSMGTTIRGAEAPHVMKARGLLNNFLTARAAAPDNSIAGRAARLKAGDTSAVYGATIEQMQEIAREAGFWGPGNWKRPKVEKFILDQVRMGDRRPANLSTPEMAKAMRGATKTQALAILEVREATESGLTKTDMKVIARELGVPLRNGDNYTMRNALAAAAKDAPGKA